MRIAIYSRRSVAEEKSGSIENQIAICREYIALHMPGSHDVACFEDEGFSGKNTDRPSFLKMQGMICDGCFDALVCYRLDRVSRSVSDFSALIDRLNALGVFFISVREQFDTGTPMGKAMLYISSVFAQLERETIAERVRDNMLLLARDGRWLGGSAPTGLAVRGGVLADGDSTLVSGMFKAYTRCGSLRRACTALTKNDISITPPGLGGILRNPVYCCADSEALDFFINAGSVVCFDGTQPECGLTAYNKRDYRSGHIKRLPRSEWIVAQGSHTGAVRGEVWCEVQRMLDNKKP